MASNPKGGGQGRGRGQGQPGKNTLPPRTPATSSPWPRPGQPPPPPKSPGPSATPSTSTTQEKSQPQGHGQGQVRSSASLFASIFGQAIFANKWQKAMTADRQAKIVELFTIPRNDPNDVYKVNSEVEVQTLAETPSSKPLTKNQIEMLHEIAMNYDYGCQLDIIEAYRPKAFISQESREQLGRLPSWLRFLVLFRYDLIHAKFQHQTHHYIKKLANYVETRRTTTATGLGKGGNTADPDGDQMDNEEIFNKYLLSEPDIIPPQHQTWNGGQEYGDEDENDLEGQSDGPATSGNKTPKLVSNATPGTSSTKVPEVKGTDKEITSAEQMRIKNEMAKVKNAVHKWKLPKSAEHDWAPSKVHRAATTLRRGLLTQPSPAEAFMVAEDDRLAKNEKGLISVSEVLDEDDTEEGIGVGTDRFKKATWEDIVTRKEGFKEEIAQQVEKNLRRIPPGLSAEELAEEERLAELVAKKNHKRTKAKQEFLDNLKNPEFIRRRRDMKLRKKDLEERDPFRKYSNIWYKNCPVNEPIKQAKRFPHHYRCDESFHAYVMALVGSAYFKIFIMLAIIANAVTLAVETSHMELHLAKNDHIIFDILDNIFLSIYLVEFILKVYAHPYRYWRSGFNIFDFVILILSLAQAILTWSNLVQIPGLKLLVIFRALRILRGISMSVQIQVLITALVETLKTHVLSVLLLLFLLMYITAIIAFYFFSTDRKLRHPWGNILQGMLRLFSFVTLDGWTDTNYEFERAGHIHTGRIFCLVCVLLGNFLISNIFIAIIIMQISEATEAYRTRERDEREEVISLKKEIVFRRQKLDLRQLLANQHTSSNADFYYLASQFLKLLRHDDLVEMNNIRFSPLWMDSFYKSAMRCHHTANVLMNLHRQMADNLLEMHRKNSGSRYTVTPIRRSRYNRYMKLKARLAVIRQEFYRDLPPSLKKMGKLRVNIGKEEGREEGQGQTQPQPLGWRRRERSDKDKSKDKKGSERDKRRKFEEDDRDDESLGSSDSDTTLSNLT